MDEVKRLLRFCLLLLPHMLRRVAECRFLEEVELWPLEEVRLHEVFVDGQERHGLLVLGHAQPVELVNLFLLGVVALGRLIEAASTTLYAGTLWLLLHVWLPALVLVVATSVSSSHVLHHLRGLVLLPTAASSMLRIGWRHEVTLVRSSTLPRPGILHVFLVEVTVQLVLVISVLASVIQVLRRSIAAFSI